jgi:polar amino acid transport system substrate-binding protein
MNRILARAMGCASVVLTVLVGTAALGAQTADTLDAVKRKGVLAVGVNQGVPPFCFVDPQTGELAGYDVDFAAALAAKLGVKPQLQPVSLNARVPELLGGNIDVIAANLLKSPDKAKVIDFSDVYLVTGQGFLARRGAVKALADLRGRKIGVLAGTESEESVRAALPSATVVSFTDLKKGVMALQTGEIDAASGDISILPAVLWALPAGEFEVAPVQVGEIPYVLGVRKDDQGLLAALNRALREMKTSGEDQALFARWFRQPAKQAARRPASDAPVATAAGVVTRRAATSPGVVVVAMEGTFSRHDEVSVFTREGDFVCKGTVTNVFGDEVYVDVDPAKYDGIDAGFAVGVNVNMDAVYCAIREHQGVLRQVAEQSKKDQAARVTQREQEGIAKERRQSEADQRAYESLLRVQEERARNNDYYNYHYHRRW